MRKRRLQTTHADDVATSGRHLGRRHQIGSQVGEGRQHESAFPHAGVGHGEIGFVYEVALDPEDVGVEGAGTPMFLALSLGGRFEAPAALEEDAGRVGGEELDDEVQVVLLAGWAADGLGLIDGRDGDEVAGGAELLDGAPEVGAAVAEI
jgi:hypothetical protein